MKQYRTGTFEGVQMTAGQLRDLVGDQTTDLAECKLRSVRELPDSTVVAIAADEVRQLGGTVGVAIWQYTNRSPAHVVRCLCLEPHMLKCQDLRMLAANSKLKHADVLATALKDAPPDSDVTVEKEFFELLQSTGHRRNQRGQKERMKQK